MKDAVWLECDCKIDVTVISCRATACNAFFSVITVAVVLAFGNAYLINIAWNLNIPSFESFRRLRIGVPHQPGLRLYRHGGSDLVIEGLAAEGAVLVHVQIVAHLDAAQGVRCGGRQHVLLGQHHGLGAAVALGHGHCVALHGQRLEVHAAPRFHRAHVLRRQRGLLPGAAVFCTQHPGHGRQAGGVLGGKALFVAVGHRHGQGAALQPDALHHRRTAGRHGSHILSRQVHRASLAVDAHHLPGLRCRQLCPVGCCLCPRRRIFRAFSPCRCRPGRRLCLALGIHRPGCCGGRRLGVGLCAGCGLLRRVGVFQHPGHKGLVLGGADFHVSVGVQSAVALVLGGLCQGPVTVRTQGQQHPLAAGAGRQGLVHRHAVFVVQQHRCGQGAVQPLHMQRHAQALPFCR